MTIDSVFLNKLNEITQDLLAYKIKSLRKKITNVYFEQKTTANEFFDTISVESYAEADDWKNQIIASIPEAIEALTVEVEKAIIAAIINDDITTVSYLVFSDSIQVFKSVEHENFKIAVSLGIRFKNRDSIIPI